MLDLLAQTTPMATSLISWFVETTLVAAVLAAIAVLASRSRRIGPAVRHAFWLVVLIKMVTPPIVAWPWSEPWLAVALHRTSPQKHDTEAAHITGLEFEMAPALDDTQTAGDAANASSASADGSRSTRQKARGLAERLSAAILRPWREVAVGLMAVWGVGSLAVALVQVRRIAVFRRRLRNAALAPRWLIAEALATGRRLGVHVPAVHMVRGLGSPLLWCLGRPVLLVPADLVQTLEVSRWRSILGVTSYVCICGGVIRGSGGSRYSPVSSGGGTPFTGWPCAGWTSRRSLPVTPGCSGQCPRIALDTLSLWFGSVRLYRWPNRRRPRWALPDRAGRLRGD